jgi:hypothetical protein
LTTTDALQLPTNEKSVILFDPDDGLGNERVEKSVAKFLIEENKYWGANEQLHMNNVFKWVKAYDRGEYLEWDGLNNLNKLRCCSKKIIERIDSLLSLKHPTSAHYWNQLVKSPSSPDSYGVVARRHIKAGTFLGFYQGTYFETIEVVVRRPHVFKIREHQYIDASTSFDSCYARHYNWSTGLVHQNVCVERLSTWSDANRAICFVANIDIPPGVELILAHNQGKLNHTTANQNRYKTIHSRFGHLVMAMANEYPEA